MTASSVLLILSASALQLGARAEVISDVVTSSGDERRALELRAEQFWTGIADVARDMNLERHLELYADVERVVSDLPPENSYVREALRESLEKLRNADELVLSQGLESSRLASDKLLAPSTASSASSFLFGGQNFFQEAFRSLTDSRRYSDRLLEHIKQRQIDVLPTLRATAAGAGSVLSDCRVASKRAFDVPKYDIYNKGVPKTPKSAKDVADRLVDAAAETRKRFTGFVVQLANGLAQDVGRRDENPSRTVTRASLERTALAAQPAGTEDQLIDL